MDSIRIRPPDAVPVGALCCRCAGQAPGWDRIAGKPYCPDCQESVIVGDAPPIIERTERHRCTVCASEGTVRFLTFPLHSSEAIELDLCPEHLRGLRLRLGGQEILQGVDVSVRAGEIVTVIGPNGAGKSMLARALLGLVALDGGTVARGPGLTVGYLPQAPSTA